ncbi:phosphate ABC transporter permease PstA [Pseudonocardia pini]|uniref:phosphate ABC transporter permease PstA n=1 Tax=Pseudonocardia pini TaxID=2758030 RepID=UPI0015EFE140|nr:phosphate ABC transporter permease PstA [Pseudonocardia pini]
MSTGTERNDLETQGPELDIPATPELLPKVQGSLPKGTAWGILAASAVVVGGILAATGFSIGLWVFLTVVLFAVATYVISRVVEGPRKATDRLVTVVVGSAFAIAMIPLVSVIWTVISNGVARFDAAFFTNSMRGVVGEGGGAYHAILGTLIITALAALMSIPIGMLTAVYLVEYGKGRLARAITFFVDVMTGIPSIVAGLFAYALFALIVGPGVRMGFAGAVALTVLMIPIVVRSTEEMLKIVPNELREASYALGVPKWKTILKIVIPTTAGGIATGITLAIARVIGETAPLLIAVGITTGVNLNPFDDRMATLPVFAYYSYVAPGIPREPFLDRAWTAALVLMVIVMLLNIIARIISRAFAPKTR